jgi:hypothetical protein
LASDLLGSKMLVQELMSSPVNVARSLLDAQLASRNGVLDKLVGVTAITAWQRNAPSELS